MTPPFSRYRVQSRWMPDVTAFERQGGGKTRSGAAPDSLRAAVCHTMATNRGGR